MLSLRTTRLCLALLVAGPTFIAGTHFVCTWQDQGTDSPESYGYKRFCLAPVSQINDTHAEYHCDSTLGSPKLGKQVALYGFMAANLLEIENPCGTYGYAGHCHDFYSGACNNTADAKQDPNSFSCKFFGRHDDCEWPDRLSHAPAFVDIWHKHR